MAIATMSTREERAHFARVMSRLVRSGLAPVALYGAGRVCRRIEPLGVEQAGAIVGVIDDDESRRGESWAGLEVISLGEARARGVRSVVITAEGAAQDALWAKRHALREAGMQVLCCPSRFPTQVWDDCLIEHYEHRVGKANGKETGYARDYPAPDATPSAWLLDALLADVGEGETVCEIGPGAGMWTSEVVDRAGEYYAVDYSERLLFEVLEHRFADRLGKLSLVHDETARLAGVPDASVDVVFSFDVFVHFKMDLVHQFVNSMARVLRPGGRGLVHFLRWDADAIRTWEECHTEHHNGGVSYMHYNEPAWVRASAERAGMELEVVGERRSAWLGRFEKRG